MTDRRLMTVGDFLSSGLSPEELAARCDGSTSEGWGMTRIENDFTKRSDADRLEAEAAELERQAATMRKGCSFVGAPPWLGLEQDARDKRELAALKRAEAQRMERG